jgi:predicted O-methyltransferase YrrM
MKFDDVASLVKGIPYTDREDGRILYDHVIRYRPRHLLELGFAHGVASMYLAAALDEIGGGELHAVDLLSEKDRRDPSIEQLAERCGLSQYISVYREHTSYTWFLKKKIEERTRDRRCEPFYDFVFIDGPKNWTIDGMAFFCADKLLNEGGWVVFDDMDWYYGSYGHDVADGLTIRTMGEDEIMTPQIRALFELVVMQHPGYSRFIDMDNGYGWAQKVAGTTKSVSYVSRRSLLHSARRVLKRVITGQGGKGGK